MKQAEIELIASARITNSHISCRLSRRHNSRVTFVSTGERVDSLLAENTTAFYTHTHCLAEKGATSIFFLFEVI